MPATTEGNAHPDIHQKARRAIGSRGSCGKYDELPVRLRREGVSNDAAEKGAAEHHEAYRTDVAFIVVRGLLHLLDVVRAVGLVVDAPVHRRAESTSESDRPDRRGGFIASPLVALHLGAANVGEGKRHRLTVDVVVEREGD